MVYVPPEYPGTIPTAEDLPDRADDVDWMYAARYNELKKELRAIMIELGTDPAGASADVKTRLALLALKTNVLELDNVNAFTPDADYEPATKKYVDDAAVAGFTDRGDPADWDFTEAVLTTDATWRDLDLSGIVPAGATAVVLNVRVQDDAVASWLLFRKNGNANIYSTGGVWTQVADLHNQTDLIIPCDSNRVIEYMAKNLVWSSIVIAVKGWWM